MKTIHTILTVIALASGCAADMAPSKVRADDPPAPTEHVTAIALQPATSTATYADGVWRTTTTPSRGRVLLPLRLPAGAVLTRIDFMHEDDEGGSADVALFASELNWDGAEQSWRELAARPLPNGAAVTGLEADVTIDAGTEYVVRWNCADGCGLLGVRAVWSM